jgi:predicted DsbA family dithiol-disulfide isomerase
MLKKIIIIDIYSDTICPWCYIGLNKLKSAMEECSDFNYELVWRPFQLNSDMPIGGMERQKYLETKFNGRNAAQKAYQNIDDEGKKNKIYFQFNKINITPNSFKSHKLLALAHISGKQTEIVESLFYGYFIEGIDIGNHEELIKIAKLHNIYNEETADYLKSDEDNESLKAEEKHAHELGITGVPCFIINKETVLFGAQDKKIFLDIFSKIYNEH